jgi:hypothetical protein
VAFGTSSAQIEALLAIWQEIIRLREDMTKK